MTSKCGCASCATFGAYHIMTSSTITYSAEIWQHEISLSIRKVYFSFDVRTDKGSNDMPDLPLIRKW